MELQTVLENRYSARDFISDESCIPSAEQINAILEAGRLAPTACNNQSQRIWVVTKQEDLAKIDKATSFRYGAQCVLILGFDERVAAKHDRWGGEVWSFGHDDAISVLMHMMLKATDLGLATCWLGGFDDSVVRSEFNIPDNVCLRALLDIGVPSKDKGKPSKMHSDRLPLSDTVTWL